MSERRKLPLDHLVEQYRLARITVVAAGYKDEIILQERVCPEEITGCELLSEAAWVILCSGFRESVIRSKWLPLTLAFRRWYPNRVLKFQDICFQKAKAIFGNNRKLQAIIQIARMIEQQPFSELKCRILADPLIELRKFPFIGPVTVYHLAKNLGFQVAKPDRHLVRMMNMAGFDDVQEFCRVISDATGDSIPVVDIVLWRYATFNSDYKKLFEPASGRVNE